MSATPPDTIATIETFRVPPRWLFVRVQTTGGLVGWGEATLEGHSDAVEGAFAALREKFTGWDADAIEDVWQHAYRGGFYRGGPVLMSALSGLDIALWDIKGRRLGTPIWQLLGGKVRDRVRVYAWIGGDDPSVDEVEKGVNARLEQGFRAVKMNATGPLDWLDSPSVLNAAVQRVALAKSLGVDVGVDFHGRVHKPMAKQLARLLEAHQPLFIEEPLLPTQPEEMADLARATSCPIATGERLFTRHDFRPYLERRAIDIAQPDVSHCGGISELKRIATLTETYDVALAPHCPLGPIALAACMQVGITCPNYVFQEMSSQIHYNQGADLTTYLADQSVFNVNDGYVAVPHGPGLGIDVNEALVRESAATHVVESPWRSPTWRGPDGSLREW